MNILVPYLSRWSSLNRSRYCQILSCLAHDGHGVYLVQPPGMESADSGFVEAEYDDRAAVHLLDMEMNPVFWNVALPFEKIMKKGAYCMKINAAIHKLIRTYDIDVVLFYAMALYPLAERSDVVTVYDLGDDHVDLLHQELGRFSNRLVQRFAGSLLRRTLKKCDRVFSVSRYLSDKYFPASIHLPNGVDLDAVRRGCGRHLWQGSDRPVIGFIGSLEYFIDFEQITEAAALRRNYTFVIAGGGRQYEKIRAVKERLRLDNLVLTGGLPHAEVLTHVDSFDICLSPFRHSPLTHGACPIKLFEYLAFEKPVISSRIEEVQRIGNGFLYWADSSGELVSRIDEILEHPEDALRRAKDGFRAVQESYTWPRIAQRFAAVVQDCLEVKFRC